MNDENRNQQDVDELQFDQAELNDDNEQQACNTCQKSIIEQYYEAGGRIICKQCKDDFENSLNNGSGVGRFFRALLFGIPAAAMGSGIYYGVSALTGYEFGLIAIVIGFMVGWAVRKGANYKGGWLYQGLAMLLTYCAIVSTYVPYIIDDITQNIDKEQASIEQKTDTIVPNNQNNNSEAELEANNNPDIENTTSTEQQEIDPISAIMGLLIFAGLIFIMPFLAGFQNIIGIIIIGIGLYEAWKMNKRVDITINGPFKINTELTGAVDAT